MKRPSFQFYPGDWMNDAALRMVSVGARGLWIDMMCIMHQGSEYGYLKVNGKVILASNLARMTGSTLEETEGFLGELEAAGVFSRDDEDCIFSRRMIRDEKVRQARAAGGSKGGNPALTGKRKDNLPFNLEPTPSSSSSSSTSSPSERKKQRAPRFDAQAHLVSRGVDPQVADDWLKLRKDRRLTPTATALEGIEAQAAEARMTLEAVIRLCCNKGWGGFEASWLTRDSPRGAPVKQSRHNGFDQIDYREGVAPDGTF
ncbi:hypothetical protein [Burkholderia gladioli]|uniref:hypothetical protein n=1 Tax=Burkholderia gladioli TaxID=28095 RepID=UPI00163F90D8|nr:hypothetical protein [Burkholderia gladioli]